MTTIDDLLVLMERLRTPGSGCPWDLRQTFETVAPYTIEEAYEVAEAITERDYEHLATELGDLLFQVVFHAQIAREQNLFDFHTVVSAIVDKMTRRHPHVFAGEKAGNDSQLSEAWEAQKQAERQHKQIPEHLLDTVSTGLPALVRAEKMQRKAAKVGFDWNEPKAVLSKLDEEVDELRLAMSAGSPSAIEEELGDLLFTCVNLARHLNVDSESALRGANQKFEKRFRLVELGARERHQEISEIGAAELEQLWDDAKRTQSGGA